MTRRVLLLLLFLFGVIALALSLRHYLPARWIVENEERLRDAIRRDPVPAWLIGFGIYVAASFVPASTGKSMICGWLFGMWPAVLMVDCALTTAAVATFFVSRYALRDVVESRFHVNIERINRGLERDGAFYLLLLRLAQIPYTLLNYGCGATRVRPRTFWWTTQLGMLPRIIVFVFAGTRLPTLGELFEQGPLRLIDPWLIAGLALTALFPIIIRRGLAIFRRNTTNDPGGHQPA
jgi:uncharacterized membrane protein YdjX (TVP38/TMEM64 family)